MTIPSLTESDVAQHLSYPELIELMKATLIEFSSGAVVQPVREMLTIEDRQRYLGVMPAAMTSAMGAKLVAFYPKNAGTDLHTHMASILLFEPATGEPLAVMDGRLITEMRTAATSAAVTRALADPASKTLALIGSGVQARAHLAALSELYSFDDVRVWSRTAAHAEAFADNHGADCKHSAQEAVEGADIVVCATSAKDPVVNGEWLSDGAHLNSVGSPRPDWRELDDAAMANIVIADSRDAVMKEAGDVILSGASIHAEAGEVLSQIVEVDASQTTIFKSVGLAVEDMATARMVYDGYKNQ